MSTERLSTSHSARSRAAALGAGLALVAGAAALPAAAEGKTYRATVTDPAGDGPVPSRDIIESKIRYSSSGSLLVVLTVAAPIDPANADAVVGVSIGTTCKKLVITGGGVFSEPDPVAFSKVTGKKLAKPVEGQGEITSNVYTLKVKHSTYKGLKPGCFAVGLVDPATPEDEAPVFFDQTGETKIKK